MGPRIARLETNDSESFPTQRYSAVSMGPRISRGLRLELPGIWATHVPDRFNSAAHFARLETQGEREGCFH